eukprot:TRINITY_DN15632_c0_g1_i1.p1 TRINITY_DN15632_c0_g1~~TRINITY_DN15632_c0_g1_i1.p1  ORF type:complete len:273 (+),score=49.11 TRINITY_DN15632_c0_g1_i1:45-821(+)
MEAGWRWLLLHFSEYSLYTHVFFGILVTCYALAGFLFFVADLTRVLSRYKIQNTRWPTLHDYGICLKNLVCNYAFVIYPLAFVSYPMYKWLGMHSGFPLPSLPTAIGQLLAFLVIEDFVHYWFHRALHTPVIYKWVHKTHHHFKYPFGLAASYAHWSEVLILGIPTYSGPLLLRPHLLVLYMWIILRQLDAVLTHCGYALPFDPAYLLPSFYGGTVAHDYHHHKFDANYGSRLTVWDKAFGTYKEWPTDNPHLAKKAV